MALLLVQSLLSPRWILLGLTVILIRWLSQKRQYPPGPRGLPIVNNLFDLPTSFEHVTYAEWGRKHGDVTYVSALGKHFLILNSIKAGNELLDQRSAIYSDRPVLPMIELMGSDFNFGFKRYSREWRNYRRLFIQHIHLNSVTQTFVNKETTSVNRLLQLVLEKSGHLREYILYCSAAIVLGVTYGYDVQVTQDPLVALADKGLQIFGEGIQPKYLPNIIPAARYIPEWFPGNRFAPLAREAARLHDEIQEKAFDGCMEKIRSGNCPPCFVQLALDQADGGIDPTMRKAIKEVSAIMYEAGVDTTTSAVQSLLIQLILHPELQERAHAELDSVIGSPDTHDFRFPRFEDRPALPYIETLCQEIFRYRPPVPRGVQHALMEDDVYRGWKIPKGAIIVANTWGMSRDEAVYSNPDVFNPDRFVDTPSKPAEPQANFGFGFGRRICPGRVLGEHSHWLQIACLLAAFQFRPPKDEQGNDMNIEYAAGLRPGFIHDPGPFPCTVLPRSKIVESAIRELET